ITASEEWRQTPQTDAPAHGDRATGDEGPPTPPLASGEGISYSDFSLELLKDRFGLRIDESRDLFSRVEPVEISDGLATTLDETAPRALVIGTEKARSELIIAPVLLEVRRRAGVAASLFSGVEFHVDPERGLRGTCDFLIGRSSEQLTIEAPVISVVEAKNE